MKILLFNVSLYTRALNAHKDTKRPLFISSAFSRRVLHPEDRRNNQTANIHPLHCTGVVMCVPLPRQTLGLNCPCRILLPPPPLMLPPELPPPPQPEWKALHPIKMSSPKTESFKRALFCTRALI